MNVNIKYHAASKQPFSKLTQDTGLETLSFVSLALENLGLDYWLSAGTVLGLFRDRQFLPNDTDIDVELLNLGPVDGEATIKLLKEFERQGFYLFRTMEYKGCYQQIALRHQTLQTLVDIYTYTTGVIDEYYINYNEHGLLLFPTNLEIKEVCGCYMPSPTEDYLEFRFGSDWRTPKHFNNWIDCAGKALIHLV